MVNGCTSPFGLENLAILREKIVMASFFGKTRLLKNQSKFYTADHLVKLDSTMYMIFNGAAKYGSKLETGPFQEANTKIFIQFMREKFMNPQEVEKMTALDITNLLIQLLLFN